jgi:hypothetical protein
MGLLASGFAHAWPFAQLPIETNGKNNILAENKFIKSHQIIQIIQIILYSEVWWLKGPGTLYSLVYSKTKSFEVKEYTM